MSDVLIISSPAVKGDTISFKVLVLEEGEDIPKSFEHATVFIDVFPRSVNGC